MKQFRPRLFKSEVVFFLEVLKREKENVKTKMKRIEELKSEIFHLRRLLMVSPRDALKGGYREKKEELQDLESKFFIMYRYVRTYKGLILRFEDLLDGKKRGRLKSESASSRPLNMPSLGGV